jgi:hypothetical protein
LRTERRERWVVFPFLLKLGYELSEASVAKYMMRRRTQPSPTWRSFIRNHLSEMAAVDFFTVPTLTFKTLYVFVVLSLDRRRAGDHLTQVTVAERLRRKSNWFDPT